MKRWGQVLASLLIVSLSSLLLTSGAPHSDDPLTFTRQVLHVHHDVPDSSASGLLDAQAERIAAVMLAYGPPDVLAHNEWSVANKVALVSFIRSQYRYLDAVELFCGSGNLCRHYLNHNLNARYVDILLGDDLLSPEGFMRAFVLVLSIRAGGTLFAGFPCNTMIWLARGHTRRSRTRVEGDTSRDDVRAANELCKRLVCLLRVAVILLVWFLIEQPSTSLLWYQPSFFAFLLSRPTMLGYRVVKHHVWQSFYGHELPKSTHLVGIYPLVKTLRTPMPQSRRTKQMETSAWYSWYQVRNGKLKRRFMGKKEGNGLKRTQEYPDRFADALALLACGQRTLFERVHGRSA